MLLLLIDNVVEEELSVLVLLELEAELGRVEVTVLVLGKVTGLLVLRELGTRSILLLNGVAAELLTVLGKTEPVLRVLHTLVHHIGIDCLEHLESPLHLTVLVIVTEVELEAILLLTGLLIGKHGETLRENNRRELNVDTLPLVVDEGHLTPARHGLLGSNGQIVHGERGCVDDFLGHFYRWELSASYL